MLQQHEYSSDFERLFMITTALGGKVGKLLSWSYSATGLARLTRRFAGGIGVVLV